MRQKIPHSEDYSEVNTNQSINNSSDSRSYILATRLYQCLRELIFLAQSPDRHALNQTAMIQFQVWKIAIIGELGNEDCCGSVKCVWRDQKNIVALFYFEYNLLNAFNVLLGVVQNKYLKKKKVLIKNEKSCIGFLFCYKQFS